MAKPRELVIFLCTGNSCRSQMAEGFLKKIGRDRFDVRSAGTEPAERVNPFAVKVMAETGIDITGQQPKSLKEFLGAPKIGWLITVCDAASRACPRLWPMPNVENRLHWPFDDPAEVSGSDEQKLVVFRRIRDEIRKKLELWMATL